MNTPSNAHTHSGFPIWFDHPERTPVVREDLRFSLRMKRYNAAYNVTLLAHSALTAKIASIRGLDTDMIGICVAHDFHEIYVGDRHPSDKSPAFRKREEKWMQHVYKQCELPYPTPEQVKLLKECDRAALLAEMTVVSHPAALWSEEQWEPYGGRPDYDKRYVSIARNYIIASDKNMWLSVRSFVALAGGVMRTKAMLGAG